MADSNVLGAQQWLNSTYGSHSDYIHVAEDGNFGNANSYALVSALQIELGISPATGSFGPATMAACDSNQIAMPSAGNRITILQYGLFCKGYNPGNGSGGAGTVTGIYDQNTINAVEAIQGDAGLQGSQISSVVSGMQMKAVLGVDWYVLSQVGSGGDSIIRSMQQYLNHMYIDYFLSDNNNNRGLIPADGVTQAINTTALIFGFQAEEGLPTSLANGNFGPTTQAHAPNIPYSGEPLSYNGNAYDSANITRFIILAQYMLYLNGFDPNSFGGAWDTATKTEIVNFQSFVKLPGQEAIGLNEWMSLLVSTGNPNRGTNEGVYACDCVTRLDVTSAAALHQAGFNYVGRYLTGTVSVNGQFVFKNLTRAEMKKIFLGGLSLFVIFEDQREYFMENPNESDIYNYFTYEQGIADAEKAFTVARALGVPRAQHIYFAVDYDFMGSELDNKVVPYFQGIATYIGNGNYVGSQYKIGIYAARNTCAYISGLGYSSSSFVAGMSTGWSGNAGFPLPSNWAFDQIQETTVAGIAVDRNVYSGQNPGFSAFENNSNEWDLTGSSGQARVRITPDAVPPHFSNVSPVEVYWTKALDGNNEFVLKNPMWGKRINNNDLVEQIEPFAIFSPRETNQAFDSQNPNEIFYALFRDSDGLINSGYISLTDNGTFYENYGDIGVMQIWRDPNDPGGATWTADDPYEQPSNPDYGSFILTQPLQYVDSNGNPPLNNVPLPIGTTIQIMFEAAMGASFSWMVEVHQIKQPGSSNWEYLFPSSPYYGFVDLDFEHGVLPSDRTLISGEEPPVK